MLAERLHGLTTSLEPAFTKTLGTLRSGVAKQRANRPAPRAVRRAWIKRLEDMGRFEVQDRLNAGDMMHVGPSGLARFVDIGLTHGKHRFPTRAFVETWLGNDADEETLEAEWRLRAALVSVAVLLIGGIPFLV